MSDIFSRSASSFSRKNRERVGAGRLRQLRKLRRGLLLETLECRQLMAGDITGTVFDDVNRNGVDDPSENGLPGWTVFVDTNGDGTLNAGEPSATTDEKGKYVIAGIPAGNVSLYEVLEPGWSPTPGFSDHQTVRVRDGREVKAKFPNVTAPVTTGRVSGSVFEDDNENGLEEPGEHGLTGWTVFVDTNGDGQFTDGEPMTVTDADGNYSISGVPAGSTRVYEVPLGGLRPTVGGLFPLEGAVDYRDVMIVAGGNARADFGNLIPQVGTIQGTVWEDTNGDGARSPGENASAGRTVFIDLNANGGLDANEPVRETDASGQYSFINIHTGSYRLTEVLPEGWITSVGKSSVVATSVVTGGVHVADYFNLVPRAGSITGTIFSDIDSNGTQSAAEPGLEGWQIYIDANRNGFLDVDERSTTTDPTGTYSFADVPYGDVTIRQIGQAGFTPINPIAGRYDFRLLNGENRMAIDFANHDANLFTISGTSFFDANGNGVRDADERGLAGLSVYIDVNLNGELDPGEPSTTTSGDLFFTPGVDETGRFSFTHLTRGTYRVREIVSVELEATQEAARERIVSVGPTSQTNVDFANVFRSNEIHGIVFDDSDADGVRDASEQTRAGVRLYLDLDRDDTFDVDEPETESGSDGSYSFSGLVPGAYVVREKPGASGPFTYPLTNGVYWPTGNSNPAVGIVSHTGITISLAESVSYRDTYSITLPTGFLSSMADVFLLFDDTGSFVGNSPIVRAAFPQIMSELQTALPGIDLGFGVGRFEEYASFAGESSTGRPFILNQPIVASSTPGMSTAIQAALDRVAPGFGGDQSETDIEALYQLVTGLGFDGNNNGTVTDSGPAGLATTQLTPGGSGDVPSFASFTPNPASNVLPADGNVGGGGFRAGSLPVILLATDTGFAYQPKGETTVLGVSGTSVPVSALTQTSRASTPFGSGAGLQETVTALNALGALVIGLGTNPLNTVDPRQSLESLATLTGAVNRSEFTIDNGTTDPIAPGDPLYFQITTGFAPTVAAGVVNAIENAVRNTALDISVRVSDPRVRMVNHSGVIAGVGAGQTAAFDIEFLGDGRPHRFDLQFVRAGTNVVLGSIPITIGTPVSGEGYHFVELEDGEYEESAHYGHYVENVAPSFLRGDDQVMVEDAGSQLIANWATSISAGPASEAGQLVDFLVENDNPTLFSEPPTISPEGTLAFTPAPDAHGNALVTVRLHDNGGVGLSGSDTSAAQSFTISITSVNDAPIAFDDEFAVDSESRLMEFAPGVLGNDLDVDGDTLTVELATPPLHGTVSLSGDGSFEYVPDSGYHGIDSFTYQASDGLLSSNIATVTIDVTAVNDAPIAAADLHDLTEDATLTIAAPGILENDFDQDGDLLSALLVTGTSHGTLSFGADGSFQYIPAPNFFGEDNFTYLATDGSTESNLVTVTLSVASVNDVPSAMDDLFSVNEDATLTVAAPGVIGNDTDPEGSPLSATRLTNPSHGTLTFSANGSFTYRPAANYHGTDSFTYRVSDGSAISNVATVTLDVHSVNDVPVPVSDTYSTNLNQTLTVAAPGILSNDLDADGDPMTAILGASPANGDFHLNTNGSFTYIPAPDFSGVDSFTYRVSDGTDISGFATVSITVTPPPPPATRFFVVDQDRVSTFQYGADGSPVSSTALDKSDSKPFGIASNATGTMQWVIDGSGTVFVYDKLGSVLGQWTPRNIGKPEGITVWGNDLWIVDPSQDRVFSFVGGANLRSGRITASSSFALNAGNLDATDLVTDGARIWVLNNTLGNDSVFRYSLTGSLQGSWRLSTTNPSPTGITLDPNDINHLWVVDASTDNVYQYDGATSRTSGTQEPSVTFNLAAGNTNPQGIADPLPTSPAGVMTLATTDDSVGRPSRRRGHGADDIVPRQESRRADSFLEDRSTSDVRRADRSAARSRAIDDAIVRRREETVDELARHLAKREDSPHGVLDSLFAEMGF